MRTPDEIRADIATTTLKHDQQIAQFDGMRDGFMEKVKDVTKKIATEKRAKASALRRLHTELGAAVAAGED